MDKTVVSDTDTILLPQEDPAVVTWSEHGHWQATSKVLSDSKRLWNSYWVQEPQAQTSQKFQRTFDQPAAAFDIDGTIDMSADNGYKLWVNGTLAADFTDEETNYFIVATFDLKPATPQSASGS